MTNQPSLQLDRCYPGHDRNLKLTHGEAIIGHLHWRRWSGEREGYQYCPWGCGRSSRVLRSDLFEALTKAARLRADEARDLIARFQATDGKAA